MSICSGSNSVQTLVPPGTGSGQLSSSTQAHSKGINAVAILPTAQGPLALSAAKDHTVRLWSAPAMQATSPAEAQQAASCLAVYKGHTDAVEDVAASPSGNAFCSGAWDGNVHIWRTGDASPAPQADRACLIWFANLASPCTESIHSLVLCPLLVRLCSL